MPGQFLVIVFLIIGLIARVSSRANKTAANRPGQGAKPAPAAKPAPSAAEATPVGTERETPAASAWPSGAMDESDLARSDLSEGDSRECDHGSVGGSMDITTHQGQGVEFEHAKPQVHVNVRPTREAAADTQAAAAGAIHMTAAEMRRAVVAAEILKRPSERRAAGRWPAR